MSDKKRIKSKVRVRVETTLPIIKIEFSRDVDEEELRFWTSFKVDASKQQGWDKLCGD